VDLVTSDVIVRDDQGQFVSSLSKNDFDVYEDGVKQDLVTFVLTHGGRVINDISAPPPPLQAGILLPPPRPTNDASGRIFMIFVDDLHMDFNNTGRIRDLFKKVSKELIHEGDMFGIVSTGPSSIAIDMTYDRKRLDEAINKISGAGLKPDEIIETPEGAQGPPEVRYRAHVAFSDLHILGSSNSTTGARVHLRQQRLRLRSRSRAKEANQRFSNMTGQTAPATRAMVIRSSGNNTNPFRRGQRVRADLASEFRAHARGPTSRWNHRPARARGRSRHRPDQLICHNRQDHIRETQSSCA
jgi:VWFA-related protein